MKFGFATLAVISVFALSSCDNATSKIKDKASAEVEYGSTEAGNDQQNSVRANQVSSGASGAFEFNKTTHDFGDIQQGETVETTFEFTNSGDAPLIITKAVGSCGCTVPEWPREPIAPGASASMKVSFNSAGKRGMNNKNVTITANTVPPTTVLNIRANVLVDGEDQ